MSWYMDGWNKSETEDFCKLMALVGLIQVPCDYDLPLKPKI